MSTTFLSVLLGVAGMLGWGVYDFLGGVLARRFGSLMPLYCSQVVGLVCIGAVSVAAHQIRAPSSPAMGWSLGAAALYCAGYLFFFRGFEKGSVSVVAATMNLWAVFTMAVAFVLMGQRLTGTQTVGAVLIIGGATVASVEWSRGHREGFGVSHGVTEAVLGAFFFGLYWNVSEVIAEDLGWLSTTLLIKAGIVVILTLVVTVSGWSLPVSSVGPGALVALTGMGVVEVGAVAAVNHGLAIGDAILITPIASALSVVTILLAVAVLKERIGLVQTMGAATAAAGIVVTAL